MSQRTNSTNTAIAAALPERARLALEIARRHDQECDETTAFVLFAERPGVSIDRLQRAIRSETRRERGQRVFTPHFVPQARGLPLTADLDHRAPEPEPHHFDDPAALVELKEIVEAVEADVVVMAALAEIDRRDDVALNDTLWAAKALNLSRRRAQQMRALALAGASPREEWAELVRGSASRAAAKARRLQTAKARRRRAAALGQLNLFRRGGRNHG